MKKILSNQLPPTPSLSASSGQALEKSGGLLIVGSVAFDSIETPFGATAKALGGSGSYFSLAASYFSRPSLIGVVGKDFKYIDVLKKQGVDVHGLKVASGKTFHWAGKYHFDLNTRDTLKTELGVFADFKPTLDTKQQSSKFVFLGNIHPALQLEVLAQIREPKLVGLDTMNLWIETARADLLKVLQKVDVFVINDSEARELSGEHNILKAAKKILGMMCSTLNAHPSTLIIKRGEYGLLMFTCNVPIYGPTKIADKSARYSKKLPNPQAALEACNDIQIFHLPGLPLENVTDPTGAGDSFAGGMFGYLASVNTINQAAFKQACLYGTAMASFCVEDFGPKKLLGLKRQQIAERVKELQNLSKI